MSKTQRVIYDGLLIAIGIVFALIVHEISGIKGGQIILPMHYSAFLAGLYIGPLDGLAVGILTPILSSVLSGMPPMMPPVAIFMALEMATYGFLAGYLNKKGVNIYLNLIIAMVSGRIVYSAGYYIIGYILGIHLRPLVALIVSFSTGIPGVIFQLLFIPVLYRATKHYTPEKRRGFLFLL